MTKHIITMSFNYQCLKKLNGLLNWKVLINLHLTTRFELNMPNHHEFEISLHICFIFFYLFYHYEFEISSISSIYFLFVLFFWTPIWIKINKFSNSWWLSIFNSNFNKSYWNLPFNKYIIKYKNKYNMLIYK